MIVFSSILEEETVLRDDRERRESENEIRDLTPIDREEILREHRLLSEEERTRILKECCRVHTPSEEKPSECRRAGTF